jgi:hypothetical protein
MVMSQKSVRNLRMYPFNTTLIGVLKGVADSFGMVMSNAWLFGGSAHAFLINIHEQLCPSGPYVWNREPFFKLVRNLGIEVTDLGYFSVKSTPEERGRVEGILRTNIDAGIPCSLLNLENQLISGYDDLGFTIQQPWPQMDFPPRTLTFGTWKELGNDFHISFFAFGKAKKADNRVVVRDGLGAAVDMARKPEHWRREHYYVGIQAYDAWIKAVKDGFGGIHGNWWNGMVWSECRQMASGFFAEMAAKHQGGISEAAAELRYQYGNLAKLLDRVKEKELASDEKIEALRDAQKVEEFCIRGIEELLKTI